MVLHGNVILLYIDALGTYVLISPELPGCYSPEIYIEENKLSVATVLQTN